MSSRTNTISFVASVCVAFLSLACLNNVDAAPAAELQVRILVKPKSSTRETVVRAIFSKNRVRQQEIIHQLDLRVVHVPAHRLDDVLERLRRYRHIEYAEADWLLEPAALPNDPYYGIQWHLPKIGAPAAWDTTAGSSALTLAVLDSGLDSAHPDLAPLLVPGWNFFENNSDTSDVTGHGTGVAGAALAIGNNGAGVAGVAWNCRLMPLRISDTNGYASSSAIVSALTWAADHGARVANLSFSGVTKISSISNAAAYFQSKGGVIVAAAGNNATFDSAPNNPRFLLVSGTDSLDALASWSNTGSNLDLAAPGAGIVTTVRGGGYGSGTGTSFSAPVVAGVAALVLSANPALPGTQVQSILKQNADDLGPAGWDTSFGHGRVNASRAVAAALDSTPADSAAPAVALTSPSASSTVAGNITVGVNASDDVAVILVECYVDGTLLGSATNAIAVLPWDTTIYPNGSHTLQARAYDAAGNVGLSTQVTVTVQNTAAPPPDLSSPTVVILTPANNASVGRNVKVSVSATDNVGVTRVDLYVDGNLYATSTSASPVFTWNTSKVPKGLHTLRACAYDAAGNSANSTTTTVRK